MAPPRLASTIEKERVRRYLMLMVEIDTRVNLISAATSGQLNLHKVYAREFCYFQFRRICEVMALGCLILHGDIPATQSNNVRKEWNADKIMRMLAGLHEHFFPQAARRTLKGGDVDINLNSVPTALTRHEFQQLYAECGVVLHRGSIRSLELETMPTDEEYAKVVTWTGKIVDLMQEHVVTRSLVTGLYLVTMKTDAGGPQCSLFNFAGGEIAVDTVTVRVITSSQ